jgi:hypothetical protein
MSVTTIPFAEGEARLDWLGLIEALARGHALPRAEIADTFLYPQPRHAAEPVGLDRRAGDGGEVGDDLSRQPRGGQAERERRREPLFRRGRDAVGDHRLPLVTKWKTAGDSLLAASRLARPDSEWC